MSSQLLAASTRHSPTHAARRWRAASAACRRLAASPPACGHRTARIAAAAGEAQSHALPSSPLPPLSPCQLHAADAGYSVHMHACKLGPAGGSGAQCPLGVCRAGAMRHVHGRCCQAQRMHASPHRRRRCRPPAAAVAGTGQGSLAGRRLTAGPKATTVRRRAQAAVRVQLHRRRSHHHHHHQGPVLAAAMEPGCCSCEPRAAMPGLLRPSWVPRQAAMPTAMGPPACMHAYAHIAWRMAACKALSAPLHVQVQVTPPGQAGV